MESVFVALKEIPSEVIVVDNHSSDGSLEILAIKFPKCRVIANKENVGFSRANNQGIIASTGSLVLLLNPDTVVPENSFSTTISFLENNPQVGAIGMRMIDGSGKFLPESRRGLPTPWVSFCKAFGLSRLFPKSETFGRYYLNYIPENQVHEADVLSGACMLMRREALNKAGLLDEDFFMYGEDVDLSYRIQLAGYQNIYFPESTIIHFKGESTKRGSISFVFHFYRSMLLFSKKHFSSSQIFRFFIFLGVAIRAFMALFQRFLRQFGGPLIEFVIAYAGMVLIKDWWEFNFKGVPGMYPDSFIELLVPGYLLIWLTSSRLIGRYSESYGHASIIKGIALGTILISGITNFFDDYRFSKGLILIGAIWTYLVTTLSFIVGQWLVNRSASLKLPRRRRLLIIGSELDFNRCVELLKSFDDQLVLCGWAGKNDNRLVSETWLGNVEEIKELIPTLAIDEFVFCLASFSREKAIQMMENNKNSTLRFSFLPESADFIVASTQKHNRGTIYQEDNIPNILLPYNQRLKRLTDLSGCVAIVLLFPLIILKGAKPSSLIKNWFAVFVGKKSWIGLSNNHLASFGLKDGVITTADLARKGTHPQVLEAMDRIYSEEFQPIQEWWNLLKNLKATGK